MFDILGEPARRRRRKKPGKIRHEKGLSYENRCDKFLRKKGLTIVSKRYHVKGAEIDRVVRDSSGKLLGVEMKNYKVPVAPAVVRKLRRVIERSHGYLKGGIIVARKGGTIEAKKLAQKGSIKISIYKYAGARKKASRDFWPFP